VPATDQVDPAKTSAACMLGSIQDFRLLAITETGTVALPGAWAPMPPMHHYCLFEVACNSCFGFGASCNLYATDITIDEVV